MANIRERKNKLGSSYKVEVRLKGHSPQYATFSRKSDAVRWGEDVEYCLKNNLPLPGAELPLDDMSITNAIEKYLALVEQIPNRSRHTILTDRGTAGRLIGRFGRFSLRRLCREDIEEYRADRLTEVGPSSVRQDMSMLSRVYDTARVRWRFKNLDYPGKDIQLPASPPNRKVILSETQIPQLMEECRKSKNILLAPLVQLLLETGMRPEEAVLLRCHAVDLDNKIIALSKTKTDPRRVPISNNCIKLLRDLMKPKEAADLIFIDEDRAKQDKPVTFFRRAFEQAAIRAGINRPLRRDVSKKKAKTLPEQHSSVRVTLYTLRHSAATYLLMHGVDIRTVADILGHSNLSQTMRYTHMADSHKRAAVNNPDLPWNK